MKNITCYINTKKILEDVHVPFILFDLNGVIHFFNTEASTLLSISNSQALGKNINDYFPQINLASILENNETIHIINSDNRINHTIFSVTDSKNKIIGFGDKLHEGISDYHASSFELSSDIKNMFESSYDGIWITDHEGKVLFTNLANEKISGFTKKDVIGKYTSELLKENWFSHSVTIDVLNSKKRETVMCYNYKTNKHVITTGNPIFNRDGTINYIFTNIRDITALTNLKAKLENQNQHISRQKSEIEHLKSLQSVAKDIVVCSEKMKAVYDIATKVAKYDCSVLVFGKSGTGKEVITKTIVKASNRCDNPFIKINCGAIPENLIESELFGYEKGSFTGANQNGKLGLFEVAQTGTILLDEVSELPLNLQVKLLRLIQEKELVRVGGTHPISLDVRIIATTNKDLKELIDKKLFREDLYYRLNVVTINVPPLSERPEDVSALIDYFLSYFNAKYNLNKVISPDVLEVLQNYSWPGNVRELENLLESIVILSNDKVITKKCLPAILLQNMDYNKPLIDIQGIIPLKEATNLLEECLIKRALKKYGSTRKAAEILMVDQSTIVRKAQKLNISVTDV